MEHANRPLGVNSSKKNELGINFAVNPQPYQNLLKVECNLKKLMMIFFSPDTAIVHIHCTTQMKMSFP